MKHYYLPFELHYGIKLPQRAILAYTTRHDLKRQAKHPRSKIFRSSDDRMPDVFVDENGEEELAEMEELDPGALLATDPDLDRVPPDSPVGYHTCSQTYTLI